MGVSSPVPKLCEEFKAENEEKAGTADVRFLRNLKKTLCCVMPIDPLAYITATLGGPHSKLKVYVITAQ